MADDSTAGLPPDLARVLRDPSVVVPHDAAVWQLIGQWANAPSNTPSAELDVAAVAREFVSLRAKIDEAEARAQTAEAELEEARRELDRMAACVEAVDRKAKKHGDGEWVEAYTLPVGPWHQLLAAARGHGVKFEHWKSAIAFADLEQAETALRRAVGVLDWLESDEALRVLADALHVRRPWPVLEGTPERASDSALAKHLRDKLVASLPDPKREPDG